MANRKAANTRLEPYQTWGRDQLKKFLNRNLGPGQKEFTGNSVIQAALGFMWAHKTAGTSPEDVRNDAAAGNEAMQRSHKRSGKR